MLECYDAVMLGRSVALSLNRAAGFLTVGLESLKRLYCRPQTAPLTGKRGRIKFAPTLFLGR